MPSDSDKQILEWMKRARDEGVKLGALCRFESHGVLVLCLPEYGNAEQLLLAKGSSEIPVEARSDRGKSGQGKEQGPNVGTGT